MLDAAGCLGGKAAQEIKEEVGLTVRADDLFDMSAAAVSTIPQLPYYDSGVASDHASSPERVADAMYPSPGGCDESLSLMLVQKRMRRREIEELKGRETGLRGEGEMIRLKVVPLGALWREGGRDAKCLAALGLYENLKREGGLPEMPSKPDDVE